MTDTKSSITNFTKACIQNSFICFFTNQWMCPMDTAVCRSTHSPYPDPPPKKKCNRNMERHTFFQRKKQDLVLSLWVRHFRGGWEERGKNQRHGWAFHVEACTPANPGHRCFSPFTKESASEHYTTRTVADLVESVGIKEHSCTEDCEADSLIMLDWVLRRPKLPWYNINHRRKIRGKEAVRIKWDKTLQDLQRLYKPVMVLDNDCPDSFSWFKKFIFTESFVVVLKNHTHAHMRISWFYCSSPLHVKMRLNRSQCLKESFLKQLR